MIFGYDSLVSDFKKLADQHQLSHAYFFFGEPQTGKFLFARSLANYIENGEFDEPRFPLKETLIIDFSSRNDESESIGIDRVRDAERFLYQTAVSSPYRIVVIRDVEWLTDQAQNALLKILEEPPSDGVLILIARDKTVFLPTVFSRLQGIFFKTQPDSAILDFIKGYGKISDVESKKVIAQSFGRIGRVKALLEPEKNRIAVARTLEKALSASVRTPRDLEATVDEFLKLFDKNPESLELFFEEALLYLRQNAEKNAHSSAVLNRECELMQSLSVNKRVHIKNVLWTMRTAIR